MQQRERLTETTLGAISAVSAYILWGIFPLFFNFLSETSVYVVIAHRIIWSAVFVALFLYVTRQLGALGPIFRNRRSIMLLVLSTTIITINWTVFIYAIDQNQVLAISFGYFMSPMVSVALGIVFLGERQNKIQTIAIGIAGISVAIQAFGLGELPWISLALAISFAFYGYFRKTVAVGAAPGLLIETCLLVPFATAFLVIVGPTMPVPVENANASLWLLLLMCGPITAIPLILFSIGARRLRLTTIGIFQYISPSIHFVLAFTFFAEQLDFVRLVSFALIWVSLTLFTYDSGRQRSMLRQNREHDAHRSGKSPGQER